MNDYPNRKFIIGGRMDAKVKWNGRMSFTGTAESGFEVPLDAKPAVGGDDNGFRPMELMALSLAGCTAMDVISILTKMRQDVTDFEVNIQAERAEDHPKVFTNAIITYSFTGNKLDDQSVKRAIELSAVRYCPAQSMLSKTFPIKLQFEIYQKNEQGELEIIKRGQV
jgi:putative redox protein